MQQEFDLGGFQQHHKELSGVSERVACLETKLKDIGLHQIAANKKDIVWQKS